MQEFFTWIWQSLCSTMMFVRAVAYEWVECFVLIFLLAVQFAFSWWVFFTCHMGILRRVMQVRRNEIPAGAVTCAKCLEITWLHERLDAPFECDKHIFCRHCMKMLFCKEWHDPQAEGGGKVAECPVKDCEKPSLKKGFTFFH
jgi:hypothetical protein